MRELGVQEGLTSFANEVVVLVMAWGGQLVVVAEDDINGSASTIFRLVGRTSARQ
jgi:hypothetical protein